MTAFDKAEAERLIAVARDQERWPRTAIEKAVASQLEAALVEIDRLTRRAQAAEIERDAMKPVVDACVRLAELDDICMEHPGINDSVGAEAEAQLDGAVAARHKAVAAYRKTADARDIEVVRLRADAPR